MAAVVIDTSAFDFCTSTYVSWRVLSFRALSSDKTKHDPMGSPHRIPCDHRFNFSYPLRPVD